MYKKLEVGCLVQEKEGHSKPFFVADVITSWWDKSVSVYDVKGNFYDSEELDVVLTKEEARKALGNDGHDGKAYYDEPEIIIPDGQQYFDGLLKALSDSTEDFVKHDDGKPMVSLVEPAFVLGMASVLTSGARKYTPDNWRRCKEPQRYKDAALRHLYAYLGGEKNDPETGQSHLIHVACNLMFLFWFDTNEKA